MSRVATPEVCPFCGQRLVNTEAVAHLRRAQAEFEQRLQAESDQRLHRLLREQTAAIRKAESEKASAQVSKLQGVITKLQDDVAKARALAERKAEAIAAAKLREAKSKLEAEIRKALKRKVDKRERALQAMMEQLKEQNKELQRRLEHVTAADRGEFTEQDLRHVLIQAFPEDEIQRVGRGRLGADVIQRVRYRSGRDYVVAGAIVYESKDTQTWQNAFLNQAKQARETHGTPHVVLVTKAFPRNQKDLFWRDGIPIVHPARVVYLVHVIRRMIVEVHRAGLSSQGQARKTAELYAYVSGEEFRATMSGMIETSAKMKEELHEERQGHARIWARREAAYNVLVQRAAAIDGAIRAIVERPVAAGEKVILLPTRSR